MGVPIREGCLTSINFVEDQAVIAQDVHDLVLKILYKIYKSWGLSINIKLTQYLVINSDANFYSLVHSTSAISKLNFNEYLGALVTKNGLGKAEIGHRLKQGTRIIGSLNSIWWDMYVSEKTKMHIARVLVKLAVNSKL